MRTTMQWAAMRVRNTHDTHRKSRKLRASQFVAGERFWAIEVSDVAVCNSQARLHTKGSRVNLDDLHDVRVTNVATPTDIAVTG